MGDQSSASAAAIVRKTKKSSYKPLSQLNQDRLSDLSRLEKPENTARLFYYGLAGKARLRHDLNVWFRDHRHCLAVLQRQQRAVQRRMGKMQRDVRRTRRDDYKRRQEEIRDKLTSLQVKLLQRRVVQKFKNNAATKMAARGEESLVALRMKRESGHMTGHDASFKDSTSADGLLDSDNRTSAGVSQGDLSVTQHHPLLFAASSQPSVNAKTNNDHETDCDNNGTPRSESGIQMWTGRKQSVRRFSESDLRSEPEMNSASDSTHIAASHNISHASTAGKNGKLHVIPEDCPSTNDPQTKLEDSTSAVQDQKSFAGVVNKESPSPLNSRVLEVRKNRPQSPKMRSISKPRRATLATLPQTSKLKTLSPIGQNVSDTTLQTQNNECSNQQHDPKLKPDSTAVKVNPYHTKSVAGKCKTIQDKTQSLESKEQNKIPEMDKISQTDKVTKVETDKVTKAKDEVSRRESGAGSEVFSQVPSRGQVMEDMLLMLGQGEEQENLLMKAGPQGLQGSPSLATRIRQQRKQEARKRSDLLNKEPLVQYYRSVRGTLEPLLTEPSRKSFPFPSARGQYQQHKMLREEQQKDLDRRHDIDNFFKSIFNRQTEEAVPSKPAAQSQSGANKAVSKVRQMNLMLSLGQARAAGQGQSGKGASLQHLAACQYLRPYDWEAKNDKERHRRPVMTSWDAAQNSLKAGFLALDFTGHG